MGGEEAEGGGGRRLAAVCVGGPLGLQPGQMISENWGLRKLQGTSHDLGARKSTEAGRQKVSLG